LGMILFFWVSGMMLLFWYWKCCHYLFIGNVVIIFVFVTMLLFVY